MLLGLILCIAHVTVKAMNTKEVLTTDEKNKNIIEVIHKTFFNLIDRLADDFWEEEEEKKNEPKIVSAEINESNEAIDFLIKQFQNIKILINNSPTLTDY